MYKAQEPLDSDSEAYFMSIWVARFYGDVWGIKKLRESGKNSGQTT